MIIKKKIILIIAAVIVSLSIIGLVIFNGKKGPSYDFAVVQRGKIVEEVSSTGTVKSAEDINLRFETSGTVEKIYVSEGSQVKEKAQLVKLYTGKLYSQYLQAQASYNEAKAELDQLIAGSTNEEIKVVEQVVENTKVAFDDAKAKAENDLDEKYDDALVHLSNASSKANITLADLKNLESKYFYDSTTTSIGFREKENITRESFFGISSIGKEGSRDLVNKAVFNPTQENIDKALTGMRATIDKIKDILDFTREAMSGSMLQDKVSATDQSTIDTDVADTNVVLTDISTAQQAIASQKITNQTNVNSAENAFKKAEDDLIETKAVPRDVDIAVYKAKVDKARASTVELQQKLDDAVLKSPINGTIAKINVKIGEIVTAGGDPVVSLISASKFQIKVDVPEADIGKVKPGNLAGITLDAFPEENWSGQVVEIEPAETIIEGVIYYKVTVIFDKLDERVKSGMSADATIETNKKENTLFVPHRAVVYKDSKKIVRILDGKAVKEIEVETGLKGVNGEIEIISGLKEGDRVITFIKSS